MATFRKRKDTWEYRISYKDPLTQKYKVKSKGGFSKKPEAILAAADMEKKLHEGMEVDEHTTLKHFLNEWLYEYKKPNIRKNTFEIHRRNIENHINPYFKNIKLSKIKPIMYQKFLNSLTEKNYSKRTCEIIHGTMYSTMEKAVTLQKIERNPCKGAEITATKSKKSKSLEYIPSDKISTLLKESYRYGYIYWMFFKTLVETGMRKGEVAALQWDDIDLKEGKIKISKTLDFQTEEGEDLFGDPKTYKSSRTITIGKSLVNALSDHKKWQNQNKLMINDLYRHDLNLVLCRQDGDYMPKSTLFNAFSSILERCDINTLPILSLRHTHASVLLESGASMKYIQERLGHGSIEITSNVYAHISDKLEKTTIDKYDEYMSTINDE